MMFAYPLALLLLLLLPVAGGFLIWRSRARENALHRIGDTRMVGTLLSGVSSNRRRWKTILWLIAVGMLIIALAQPAWGMAAEVVETQGVAVIAVLDVSKSMDAEDVGPSRLERAKLDLQELFGALEGNDIGLILFAGNAYVQLPLTNDVHTATTFLQAASSQSITRQGTALEEALRLAIDSFDARLAADAVIVVASDGENHEGDPSAAAEDAADRGITIHTLGYGQEEGATIPVRTGSGSTEIKTDRSGSVVLTRLDETALQQIAETTGGSYRRAGSSGSAISRLAEAIRAQDAGSLGEQTTTRRIQRFGIFVALALLALSAEMLLPETEGAAP